MRALSKFLQHGWLPVVEAVSVRLTHRLLLRPFEGLQPALLGLPVQQPTAKYAVEGLRLPATHSRVWGALRAVDRDQHALILQALLNAAGQAVLDGPGAAAPAALRAPELASAPSPAALFPPLCEDCFFSLAEANLMSARTIELVPGRVPMLAARATGLAGRGSALAGLPLLGPARPGVWAPEPARPGSGAPAGASAGPPATRRAPALPWELALLVDVGTSEVTHDVMNEDAAHQELQNAGDGPAGLRRLAVEVLACSIAALGALVFFTFHLQLLMVSKAFGTGFMGRSFTWALLIVETLLPSYLFLQPIIRAMSNEMMDRVLADHGFAKLAPVSARDRAGVQRKLRAMARSQPKAGPDSAQEDMQGWLRWAAGQLVGLVLQPRANESGWKPWLRLMLTAPLSMVPGAGLVVYAYLNGYPYAKELLLHYTVRKGLNKGADQELLFEAHHRSFSAFGAVVFLLNVIPLLNWGFMFSNVVGAGLMAVDMEKRGTLLKGAAVQDKSIVEGLAETADDARSALKSSPVTRSRARTQAQH
eukprot:jgi/Astpho2/5216/Aster-04793